MRGRAACIEQLGERMAALAGVARRGAGVGVPPGHGEAREGLLHEQALERALRRSILTMLMPARPVRRV